MISVLRWFGHLEIIGNIRIAKKRECGKSFGRLAAEEVD